MCGPGSWRRSTGLRGAMLDLLATGDSERVSAAVNRQLALLGQAD